MRERARTEKAVDFCNALFLEERATGEAKCQAANPPTEGSPPHGPGCEAGYLLCGDCCCNTNNAYCQGCSKGPTCCRIDANCCPGG
ncbi:MAG TPA: hypothetical protein VHM66_07755 [Solirubrobacterales bacterium]|nr:hypothetical protein [Solirubrobacterales bacterium]